MSQNFKDRLSLVSFVHLISLSKRLNMKLNEPWEQVCHIESQTFDDNCCRHDVISALEGQFLYNRWYKAFNCETLGVA